MRVEIVGLEPDGLLIAGYSLLELSLRSENNPQVVMRVGIIWLKADGFPVASHGFVKSALLCEGITQAVMRLRKIGLETQGLANVPDCVLGSTQLIPCHPQQMEGIHLAWINLQDLTIDLLRTLEITRLLLLYSRVEGLRYRAREGLLGTHPTVRS